MPIIKKLIRLASNAPANYKHATHAINNTSLGKTAQISIQINSERDVYTSGDLIEGDAILELSEGMDIAEITLKYKVDEVTCVGRSRATRGPHPDNFNDQEKLSRHALKRKQRCEQRQDRENRNALYRGFKTLHCQEQRIFPSVQESAAIQAKKLTLAPGTHRFAFSIRLPGHQDDNYKILPPSFSDDSSGEISHILKATVKRSSVIKQNVRCEVPIKFSPAADKEAGVTAHIVTKTIQLSSNTINATASIPCAAQMGSNFPLNVGLSSETSKLTLTVTEIFGEIVSSVSIRASSYIKRDQQSRVFFMRRGFAKTGTSLDLSEYLQNNTIPVNFTPSFQSKYIAMNHQVKITVKFVVGLASDNEPTRSLTLERHIPVMGEKHFDKTPPLGAHSAVYEYPQDSSSCLSETETIRSCSLEKKSPLPDSDVLFENEKSHELPPRYS